MLAQLAHRSHRDHRAPPRLLGPLDARPVADRRLDLAPLPTQVPGIKHAVAPYCYRCPLKLTYPSCGVACAKDIEELIRTTTSGRVAGFLAETIQGVGGFITPPPEYFEIAVGIVRKYGGVFICDEVQTGFGRTGGKFWGIEHYGVEPDIMTMAKGIANGLPLGACIATPEIAASLKALTISTFGGNPVSCAAANATIRIIEEDDLPGNAERMGRILRDGFEELKRRFPRNVGDVRGMGLMQAIELVVDETTGDRTPDEGADEPRLRGDQQAGPARRQERPGGQRLPRRAAPERDAVGRRGSPGHHPRVLRGRRGALTRKEPDAPPGAYMVA